MPDLVEKDSVKVGVERGKVDSLPGQHDPHHVSHGRQALSTENKYEPSQQNSIQEKYLQHNAVSDEK